MLTIIIGAVGCVFALILIAFFVSFTTAKSFNLSGAHVLVTGGSSGIGKAIAVEVAKRGANVTLLARDKVKLAQVKKAIEDVRRDGDKQKVQYFSVDVSGEYQSVENAIQQAEAELGPVDMLVNSAGFSVSGKFEDIPVEDFKRLLDVNYLGSVFTTRCVLPRMKRKKSGRIVFVSSQAGQIGIFGFTAYSASKFALKGMAEALQMELSPYNVHVCLAFPPDTDTPGYVEEMKTKPLETKLISETSGLFKPEEVAKTIVNDAVRGAFYSYVGVDGWMLSTLTCGMSPALSVIDSVQQVFMMGLLRLVSIGYLFNFYGIVKRCHQTSERLDETNKEQ